ncbi:bifunctional hydroxyacyl-CoA dehydrogenase/enoyl-CoA hydratase [Martiniozyma asiatica (nom. inval.)]|nr:bifunctional hydroxyacyl-CoA dehydrogenase/enoyl-CoA hydratase [Martiniozyma asiatica]
MVQVLFKDRVVIITGSGGGLGKHYALEFASRGAKVVVNDLGGTLQGQGGGNKAADLVVAEIIANGGDAVANYDNVVTNPQGILKTAIDNWGRVDILINNAGILKDSSFKKMSEEQMNDVLNVHLHGAFKLTQLCWKYFKQQNYGRVIMTASPAGLYGNFGQANYSAAKLALVGFGETLAKEGYKNNIKVNIIAPLARSRMTETILPPDVLEKLSPAKIAPLVLYLSSDECPTTGSIYEVAAGMYAQIRWERSCGIYLNPFKMTPEAVLSKFGEITDFNKPGIEHPSQLKDYNKVWEITSKIGDTYQGHIKINSLKNKVVIITGAGGGLGASHAKLFAKYGAKVVVNDFRDPDTVVNEIKSGGGIAVGSKHDVFTQAEDIVKTAIDSFGTVDILINNAGILRDKSFLKMNDNEWDQVIKIHLLSTFRLCKLVWPIMSTNGGFIINTTSTSGIYGNFGQANYAAAKAGVLGLSRTLAKEGKKQRIKVIAIAPHAETAMTKTIFTEKDINKFDVKQVSPLLVALCSAEIESVFEGDISGQLFEVGGGWIGAVRWQRAKGAVNTGKIVSETSVEFLRHNWDEVVDFSNGITVGSAEESSIAILESVGGDDEDGDGDEDEDDEAESVDSENNTNDDGAYNFDHRQVILYNLSIGFTAKDLPYVYESSPKFKAFPTFGVIPFMSSEDGWDFDDILDNYNPMRLLHGEQYLKIDSSIPTSGKLITSSKPLSVSTKVSKGKNNALVRMAYQTTDASKSIFTNIGTYFIRDAKAKSETYDKSLAESLGSFYMTQFDIPKAKPTHRLEFKTSDQQAALYRLNADFNPLHIDPEFAKGGGFDRPILHGLCTFGIAAKLLSSIYGELKEIKGRFVGVVYPGETIVVDMWDGDNIVWKAWVKERKSDCVAFAGAKFGRGASKL